jgi:hypothetical protein
MRAGEGSGGNEEIVGIGCGSLVVWRGKLRDCGGARTDAYADDAEQQFSFNTEQTKNL